MASPTGSSTSRRNEGARTSQGPASNAIAESTPATSTTQRSHGSQSGVRSSRMYDHTAVTSTVAAATERPAQPSRCSQSASAPMPTSAPMPGASATM